MTEESLNPNTRLLCKNTAMEKSKHLGRQVDFTVPQSLEWDAFHISSSHVPNPEPKAIQGPYSTVTVGRNYS